MRQCRQCLSLPVPWSGPYEIVLRLGAGGMGEVYRARDPRLGREVAIKVILEDSTPDRQLVRRFLSEAKAASALNHPNILTVYEIGETESGPYMVTELVDGQTVRELLKSGPLAVSRALEIAIQAGEGIAKAHDASIIHRDIKPENLMMTRDGYVKVLDFGLAKLLPSDSEEGAPASSETATRTGIIVGTAAYLSPEQLRGARADARSDVFSLGIVLYEMIAGENPFRRGSPADTFSAILRDEPPPLHERAPGVPQDLSQTVARALAKDPEQRLPSARALGAELKRIRTRIESSISATEVLTSSGRAAAPARKSQRVWRRPAAALALAAIVVALLFLWRRERMPAAQVKLPPNVQLAVAVIPVEDKSGDPELSRAKIGEILGDSFVQILSDIPHVYVVSPLRIEDVAQSLGRSVADAAKDGRLAVKLCNGSGANAMLTGKLSRVGQTYVLDAELTRLPHTLLGKFRASFQGLARLLPELTGGVAGKIQAKLGASPTYDASQVATASIAAYEHFVRGCDLQSEGDFQGSLPDLEKAVQIDPRMGLAWSCLAYSYSFSGDNAKALAAQRQNETLLDTVNKKERRWIELNGTWVSRNSSLFRQEAEKYIKDYPDDREGYFYAGLSAEWLDNNCAQALGYFEKAYRLTPTYYPITKGLVDCQVNLNRRGEAIAALKRYLAFPAGIGPARQQAQGRLVELQKKS
jgi:hypothetical protein